MRNYIILNGQNSNSISGLLIQSLAPISKPQMRTQTEEIDGRPGDIVTDLGFSSYDKEITIGLYGNFDINEVIAYFNSQGVVTFSNEPDKYYNYKIYDQIDFERLVRYRTATVTMHCQPFKYSTTEQPDNITPTDNLLTVPDVTKTANGVTVKAANGTITVSGKATAATEIYVPISALTLQAGSYTLTATASGQNPTNCSIRMIGSAPSNSDSFGGNYLPLVQGTTTLSGTLSASKTYNYIWFYINAGTAMGFTLNISVEDEAAKVVSDEGTNLVLEGSQLAPFSKLDLKGNTEQDGTPTPDAPVPVKVVTGENVVKICGKNLFDVANAQMTVARLNSSGTVTTGITNRLCTLGYIEVKPNTAYTLSATPENSGKTLQAYIVGYSESGSSTGIGNYPLNAWYGFPITFTTGSNCKYIRVSYRYSDDSDMAATSATNQQLELGSTATDYEPYKNQSYEVNLGKNLYDKLSSTDGKRLDTNGGEYTDPTFTLSAYIPVEPNTKYTLSGMPGSSYGHIATYDGSKTFVYRWYVGSDSYTFTTQANARYIRIATPLICKDSTQCELGSQATSYAAYFEPIQLCGLGDDGAGGFLYQDGIYKNLSDNKWYVRKEIGKVAVDSSYYSTRYGTNSYGLTQFLINLSFEDYFDSANIANMLSNSFDKQSTSFANTQVQGFLPALDPSLHRLRAWVRINTTTADTEAQFKTWLDNNRPIFYYKLDTPTDTEITNEALIEQLDNIYYHAHAYKGRTHITSSAATGNVPHIIAAEVAQNNDGVVTNSGNYFSKPRLTIYGEGEIGVYLNGIQIFQIALGSEGYITIDTAALEAYKDTTDNLKNRLVTGDYENFALRPGENQLSFSGSVTKCVVENYSRWL